MRDDVQSALARFLIEDVILTLGNLRGSLLWIGESIAATDSDSDSRRSGLDRLDRQIDALERRARSVFGQMHAGVGNSAAASTTQPGPGRGPSLATTLRDATEGEADAAPEGAPVFRSQRACYP